MQITEVQINFIKPKDGIVAFASIVLADELFLGGIAVHKKLIGEGYRITYPTRPLGDKLFNIFHPIRKPLGERIEAAIVGKVVALLAKAHGMPA